MRTSLLMSSFILRYQPQNLLHRASSEKHNHDHHNIIIFINSINKIVIKRHQQRQALSSLKPSSKSSSKPWATSLSNINTDNEYNSHQHRQPPTPRTTTIFIINIIIKIASLSHHQQKVSSSSTPLRASSSNITSNPTSTIFNIIIHNGYHYHEHKQSWTPSIK